MRVLMSGASGLIGTALTKALIDRGDEVVALVRTSSPSGTANQIHWDPSKQQLNGGDLEQHGPYDAVVHLAGAGIGDKRWTPARKAEILESRVDGTALLATRCSELSVLPSVFLSGSAIGFYGDTGNEVATEASPQGAGFLADVCRQWEGAASPIEQSGVRTVFLRTGIVLDPNGGALAKQLPLFRFGLGGKLGSGKQWFSWISIRDEVSAILAVIDHDEFSGPVNLTAPNPVTNAEFTKALGTVLRRPTVAAVPGFALKIALGSELADEALLASTRILPEQLTRHNFSFADETVLEALSDLLDTSRR
jgi:uncharacterized protein (TIGR01777 family)